MGALPFYGKGYSIGKECPSVFYIYLSFRMWLCYKNCFPRIPPISLSAGVCSWVLNKEGGFLWALWLFVPRKKVWSCRNSSYPLFGEYAGCSQRVLCLAKLTLECSQLRKRSRLNARACPPTKEDPRSIFICGLASPYGYSSVRLGCATSRWVKDAHRSLENAPI